MKTTTEVLYIGKSQQVTGEGCLAIAFFRPTTSNPVIVSGFPIEAGQTFSIAQNVGDADYSNYDVVFQSGVNTNELYVTRIMPLKGSN